MGIRLRLGATPFLLFAPDVVFLPTRCFRFAGCTQLLLLGALRLILRTVLVAHLSMALSGKELGVFGGRVDPDGSLDALLDDGGHQNGHQTVSESSKRADSISVD